MSFSSTNSTLNSGYERIIFYLPLTIYCQLWQAGDPQPATATNSNVT